MNKNIENINNPMERATNILDSKEKGFINRNFSDKEEEEELLPLTSKEAEAELRRYNKDTELKENLTGFVKLFTWLWSAAIIFLLYLISFKLCFLSDKVVITLITETLILILGLATIVVTHFFPKK